MAEAVDPDWVTRDRRVDEALALAAFAGRFGAVDDLALIIDARRAELRRAELRRAELRRADPASFLQPSTVAWAAPRLPRQARPQATSSVQCCASH